MKKSKFTEEQIVRILLEVQSGQAIQAEACHKHGVSQNIWKRKYSGVEQRDVRHLRDLESENAQLKRLLTE